MKNKLNIAIYSGDIPSTTFIERLIIGLSKASSKIYLFGYLKKKVSYNASVKVIAYQNTKIHKAFHLMTYSLLLWCFRNNDKTVLDKILKSKSKHRLLDKVKCYPVLWHKPDVFHVQWAKGLDDWMWVQHFGMKIVLSLRGAHINYSPIADVKLANMYRNNFPKIDAFHAVSKAIALEAEAYGAPKDRIKVVYSGFDLEKKSLLKPSDADVFHILSIGRPHWIKGYTYALDACKILKTQGFKFKYTIIGAANDIEFVYQVHDLGLQDVVSLTNQKPFSKVQEYIQKSDVLLLPSLKEGIANVVLEAMALETLVLSTQCGGINEIITDGKNGFLTPIRDSEAIANQVISISKLSKNTKQQIRQSALETVKSHHSEKEMIKGMLELYEQL